MSVPICGSLVGQSPAVSFIQTGWPFINTIAQNSVNTANSTLNSLASLQLAYPKIEVTYTMSQLANNFVAPTAPTAPDSTFDTSIIGGVSGFTSGTIGDPNYVAFPNNYVQTPPSYDAPTKPNALASFSATAPIPSNPAMPTLSPISNPNAPTLKEIVLPSFIPITLPTFAGVRPDSSSLSAPSSSITFVATKYSDALLDQTKSQLSTMMLGGTGLPAAVEQALFDRARAREDIAATKAAQDVREEFAARGFSLPPGALAQRLDEIRQNTQNQSNTLNRDIYIQAQTVAVENLRFSVTQAIALEQALIGADVQLQDLMLRAQVASLDATIKIFDAQVSLFNAREQAYATDAQVYRDQIQGELAKVEVYKAQIEGQRLVGEINQQSVAIYEAQLRATTTLIEQYKAQLEAVNLIRDGDRINIELYRGLLDGRKTEVEAWAQEWGGYRAQIEGQVAKGNFFSSLVNGYAANVTAVASQNNNLVAQKDLLVRLRGLDLEGYKANLEWARTRIEAERDRVQAVSSIFSAKAQIYSAAGTIATAENESVTRAFQANMENSRVAAEIALKNAEKDINEAIQQSEQAVKIKEGIAHVSSQLAASALSAMHFAAQASDGFSLSQTSGCNTSVNYQGN